MTASGGLRRLGLALVAAVGLSASGGAARGAAPDGLGPTQAEREARDPTFSEVVDVERVIIDARVVDDAGLPLAGLAPTDFRVKVDGRDVALESVLWVPGDAPERTGATAGDLTSRGAPPGRLIVFLFQKDLHPSRGPGLLRMRARALQLARSLPAKDRVAVLSLDSRLRLWLDFSSDRERIADALEQSVIYGRSVAGKAETGPSLAAAFSPVAARRATTPERALGVIAEALEAIPGPKSLVLFGWGMGEMSAGSGVHLDPSYAASRASLTRARVTVFALDITEADAHTLEFGLQQVAADTGGFYARTHEFTGQAMRRLEGALAGHYELTFVKPPQAPGTHAIDVRLVGRKGNVHARSTYSS